MKLSTAMKLVTDELERATEQHAAMNSPHEGYAVLLEEVEELWQEIKGNTGTKHRGVSEVVQVASCALRYLVDLCDEDAAFQHELKVERYRAAPYDPPGGFAGGYSG